MSNFYLLQEQMKKLVSGDMAKESLEIAENEYLMMGDHFENIKEPNIQEFKPDVFTVLGVKCFQYYRDEQGWMGVWKKGDIWKNPNTGEFEYVPDEWDMEDVRLDEVVLRPIKNCKL